MECFYEQGSGIYSSFLHGEANVDIDQGVAFRTQPSLQTFL